MNSENIAKSWTMDYSIQWGESNGTFHLLTDAMLSALNEW